MMIVSLAVPLLATQAAYAQESTANVNPAPQASGETDVGALKAQENAQLLNACAADARRLQELSDNGPNGRKDRTPIAAFHVQQALAAVAEGNEQKCESELGLAQDYMDAD
jgi:hypothetical protein